MLQYHHQITEAALALYIVLLVGAALFDTWKYIIPNSLSVALAVLFVLVAATSPHEVQWWSHVGAAAIVLGVGIGLYAFDIMGAGDVKLLTAVALWAGLAQLPIFLIYIALFGGAVSLLLLLLRRAVVMGVVMLPQAEKIRLPKVLLTGEAVPYGVGISIGAIWLSGLIPLFALK